MSFNDIAIRVTNVSKRYQIYDAPRDRLKQFVFPRFSFLIGKTPKQYFREFAALDDVSFEVKKGETVGIVGRNGAGKSTLLQIICGTLSPTSGSVQINGRIAALLELGSGFNIEFTGRENVYMYAAVMGLSNEEVGDRFEEIVTFADIGDFIEQPVKNYSSGMMVRLAFATAIHVDPDILIVDEALAVGDFAFQHKCMLKIRQIITNGVTVLLVTHDVGAVMANCNRALMLRKGSIYAIGGAAEVCDRYLETDAAGFDKDSELLHPEDVTTNGSKQQTPPRIADMQPIEPSYRWGSGQIMITAWSLVDVSGKVTNSFHFGEKMHLSILLSAISNIDRCFPGFMLRDRNGYHLTGITNRTCGQEILNIAAGDDVLLEFEITLLYRADNYSILLNIAVDEYGSGFYDLCENAGNFTIVSENSDRPPWGYGRTYLPTTLKVTVKNNLRAT
ncbi:MAG: ABC transporter ATP-binding protein [Candidatus Accumulibacter delftensis]|jgi:lipopolysaccharide transport system ATP-binding protein